MNVEFQWDFFFFFGGGGVQYRITIYRSEWGFRGSHYRIATGQLLKEPYKD